MINNHLVEDMAVTALIAFKIGRDWKDAVKAAAEHAVEETGRPSGHRELVESALTIAALALDYQENQRLREALHTVGGEK